MSNKAKINDIDLQIKKLQEEKERLIEIDKLPETERKINDYLNRTYSGKRLNEKHQLTETGLWEVRGEDPNCDLGGSHHQPKLGVVEGSLKDALTYAVNNPNFYTWGGGGDVSKITPIQIHKA